MNKTNNQSSSSKKSGSSTKQKKNVGKTNDGSSSKKRASTAAGGKNSSGAAGTTVGHKMLLTRNSTPKIVETTDPLVLFQNYSKQCQCMGIDVHKAVRHALTIKTRTKTQQSASSKNASNKKKKVGGKTSSSSSSGGKNGTLPSCVQLIIGPEKKQSVEGQDSKKQKQGNNKKKARSKSADAKKNISATSSSTTLANNDQQQNETILATNSISSGKNIRNGGMVVGNISHTNHEGSDEQDDQEVLGDGGCRALVAAILGEVGFPESSTSNSDSSTNEGIGKESKLKSGGAGGDVACTVYTAFQEIRIWRSRIGNDGARAIARLLSKCDSSNNGVNIKINLLDLLGNEIGPRGALSLGRSLCMGVNKSLLSLKLDFNRSLGCDGMVALAKGLKLNCTLKFLSLKFCRIGVRGSAELSDVISFLRTAIESLDLEGNPLGGKGLEGLCPGLKRNSTLQKISLADIHIFPTDILESMQIFGDAIAHHKTLIEVNLLRNFIGKNGGNELLKHVKENSKIQTFLVEANLPTDIYIPLSRTCSQPEKASKKKRKTAKKGMKKK